MPAASGPLADGLHRQAKRRRRSDVAEKDQPGAGRHAGPELLQDRLGRNGRQRNRLVDIVRAGLAADEFPGLVARAVLVVGGQHLVPRPQRQRAGDHVDAIGGVGNQDQLPGRRRGDTRRACRGRPPASRPARAPKSGPAAAPARAASA